MISLNVEDKKINIYNEELTNRNVPIVIHNSFEDDGIALINECNNTNCHDFILVNISNINWNDEMTPWSCPPVFKGDSECKGKADEYIDLLTNQIIPKIEQRFGYKPLYYAIAGYSLGGLFALYSIYKTDIFKRVMSGSGSFWYPKFTEFVKNNELKINVDKIYLSLGNTEKQTKNKLMSKVENNTAEIANYYKSLNINTIFELNEGNHFKDVNKRIAKGIKNILLK